MDENRYHIVFSGETAKEISDIGKFIRDLSALLKGTSVSVETLFSEKEVVIEKASDFEYAQKRCKAFEKTGVICRTVSLDPESSEPRFGLISKPIEKDIPPPIPQSGKSVSKRVPSVYDMIPKPVPTAKKEVKSLSGTPETRLGADIPPPLPVSEKQGAVKETHPPRLSKKQDELTPYSWKPAKPAALEQTVKAVSGLPKMIAPFLVQNIGWFISGFLFLTGCIFLVTYTHGFSRSLIISLILSAYTLLLTGGAYKLLLRGSELRTAGTVILTIGMLMIPLGIAASVRLTDMAWPKFISSAASIVIVITSFVLFYWTAQLSSGIMNRSLQSSHTGLFMALTAVQTAAPLVGRVSEWYLPAVLHLCLLALLGTGLVRFVREWLKSMFSEPRNLAYYTAGTLVYAASVSFIHVTWRYEGALPPGYAGPFVMVLSGLLFYADSAFKEWKHHYAFLSRFTFSVYALSIIALILSFPSFEARVITLTLGAGVYGRVFRQYLTLPPLYLLLICLCGLYHQLILQYIPQEIWFLAGIPGLAFLFIAHRHIIRHKAAAMSALGFYSLVILTLGLAGASLFISEPGIVPAATAAMLTAFLYIILRCTSLDLFSLSSEKQQDKSSLPQSSDNYDLRNSSWFYLVPISGAFSLGYCPLFGNWAWGEQFSLSLMLLSILLTEAGLSLYRRISDMTATRTLVLLNSAMLCILAANILCLLSASTEVLQSANVHLVLLISAGIFLRQSMVLRLRFLFYAVLISGGAAGAFIKYSYFPDSSTGMTEIIAALGLWAILWRAERTEALKEKIGIPESHFSNLISQFSLSWLYPAGRLSRAEVMRLPLKQFMVILWGIALLRFLFCLPNYNLTPAWALNSSLMVMSTMLFAAYFRLLGFWSAPLILGLSALLIPLYHHYDLSLSELNIVSALYALGSWMIFRRAANIPLTSRIAGLLNLAGGHNGGRHQVEIRTYRTTLPIIFFTLAAAIWEWVKRPDPAILYTLFIGIVFLLITKRYHRYTAQTYIIPTLMTMAAIVIHVQILSVTDTVLLLSDSRTGLLLAFISLYMGAVAWILGRTAEEKRSRYYKPLLHLAVLLSLIATVQQIPLISAPTVGEIPVLALGLASLGILFVNHKIGSRILCLIAMLSLDLTLLWGYAFLFHEGESLIFLSSQTQGDIHIFSALLALGFSSLSYIISGYSRSSLYVMPLWYVALADYCWVLLHIGIFFIADIFGQSPDFNTIALFSISALAIFPLSAPLKGADLWRGAGLLIMLTGLALNLLSFTGLPMWNKILIWAYMLWITTNTILPFFNTRFPESKICSEIWTGAGLIAVVLTQPIIFRDISDIILEWSYWLSVSVYLFLMFRNSGSSILHWFATGTLAWTGILLILFYLIQGEIWGTESILTIILSVPIWANIMLFAGTLWRKLNASGILSEKWGRHDPSRSFQVWSFMISGAWLLILFMSDWMVLFGSLEPGKGFFLTLAKGQILTILSFLHLFILNPHALNAHSLIFSVFALVLTEFDFFSSLPHLPLFLAVWNVLLLSITTYANQKQLSRNISTLFRAMSGWLFIFPWLVLPAMIFLPMASLGEMLLTLTIMIAVFAGIASGRQSEMLLWTAHLLFLILLHTWPLIFVPSGKTRGLILWEIWPLIQAQIPRFQILMPWYSLQMILTVWAGTAMSRKSPDSSSFIRKHFSSNISFEFALALGEWGLYLILFILRLMSDQPYENMTLQGTAGLLSLFLIIALKIFRLYHFREEKQAYGISLLTAAAGLYLRLLWTGLGPLTIYDSGAVILAGYGLFMIQRFISDKALSDSLLNMAITVPIFSFVMTISFENISSLPVCGLLLVSGTLYLSIRYTSGSVTALLLGILSLNGAVYLWIPAWANHYNLIQLYAAPGALSVLILLHLHRKELKSATLNSMRLASLTVLYACATLDFLISPELSNFLLVLFLSLTGAGIGIALRIRAFLYSGVIFMVLNVLAQLFFFYSRQTLGKGIVLVFLGTVIMIAMIIFNIKRETVLKRIRIFRADLEQWK